MKKKHIVFLVTLALAAKFALFVYTTLRAPEGKFLWDSRFYMQTAEGLASHGSFAVLEGENTVPHNYRTPGYPLFLALFHEILKVPWAGIVFLQILLTVGAAWLTYLTARLIDDRLKYLSSLIILLDPPVTIFSLTILTEALFLFTVAVFMYCYVRYMKTKKMQWLIWAALAVAASVYIRPVTIYLGVVIAVFTIFICRQEGTKKAAVNGLLIIVTVYGLLGLWMARNQAVFGKFQFSSIDGATLHLHGLYGSYARKNNVLTKEMGPVAYYANITSRSLLALFTSPGTLKYFQNRTLKRIGKVVSYPFMAFWLAGLIVALFCMPREPVYVFLLGMVLYFTVATVFSITLGAEARFRVPMVPFLAILSACGWHAIRSFIVNPKPTPGVDSGS